MGGIQAKGIAIVPKVEFDEETLRILKEMEQETLNNEIEIIDCGRNVVGSASTQVQVPENFKAKRTFKEFCEQCGISCENTL